MAAGNAITLIISCIQRQCSENRKRRRILITFVSHSTLSPDFLNSHTRSPLADCRQSISLIESRNYIVVPTVQYTKGTVGILIYGRL